MEQIPLAQGAEAIITFVTPPSNSKKTKTPPKKISPITKSPSRSDLTKSVAKKSIANHGEPIIIKNRISKSYRIPEIDKQIRERRTRAETKLLTKASKIINTPLPQESKDPHKITLPYIKGKKLSEHLDNFHLEKQKQILKQIGKDIAKLHEQNIIHGDLTTSNMILVNNKIFFIDFGLGYFNGKYEDKAVDIHLLKQALEAKHFQNWKELYKEFKQGYKSINKSEAEKVFNQLIKVEKRGRYKH